MTYHKSDQFYPQKEFLLKGVISMVVHNFQHDNAFHLPQSNSGIVFCINWIGITPFPVLHNTAKGTNEVSSIDAKYIFQIKITT